MWVNLILQLLADYERRISLLPVVWKARGHDGEVAEALWGLMLENEVT